MGLPRRAGLLLVFLLALALLPAAAWGAGPTVQEMVQCFMSPDQCGMPLEACPAGVAHQMQDQIAAQVAQGMSRDEIINYWVGVYGPWILAAPPKAGFDLAAWVLPGVLLVAGLAFLVHFLRRRVVQPAGPAAPAPAVGGYEEEIAQQVKRHF